MVGAASARRRFSVGIYFGANFFDAARAPKRPTLARRTERLYHHGRGSVRAGSQRAARATTTRAFKRPANDAAHYRVGARVRAATRLHRAALGVARRRRRVSR